MDELVFLKLGGSLITDKSMPYTPRFEKLAELAGEIRGALRKTPGLSLILGHGSGSFGHTAAKQHGTRAGVGKDAPASYWSGFSEVWFQASALNRFVMNALHVEEIPAVALAPIAAVTARSGKVTHWDLGPLKAALAAGLLPVVYGDVVFDGQQGGTVLSTEELFFHLAQELHPRRILLAGLEAAVWADFPQRQQRLETITPASFEGIRSVLGASRGTDVTGGMESKVREMLELVQAVPGLSVQIFSGELPGNVEKALAGENVGTLISI